MWVALVTALVISQLRKHTLAHPFLFVSFTHSHAHTDYFDVFVHRSMRESAIFACILAPPTPFPNSHANKQACTHAPLSLYVTFYISLYVIHTHTHVLFYILFYSMYLVGQPNLMYARMIGIRLQVVSIIMIAAFNPYAHHKSNFISGSNSMLSCFSYFILMLLLLLLPFVSDRRLHSRYVNVFLFCAVCFAVLRDRMSFWARDSKQMNE